MIYSLNEQATGPVTFDQAVGLMLPGDIFQLTFQKEVSKYGFTVFNPGKIYEGSKVLSDGRIRVVHEDIVFRGKTSIFTKEEFLEELKSEGEPCDLLDCNKSLFIRPGVGHKTFAAALRNPSFGSAETETQTPTDVEVPAGAAATKKPGISFYIESSSDKIKINKSQEGQYTISYEDLVNMPIEPELRRLFGYNNWEEYKRDNFEDLTKKSPTVHPFHVAYALEEFLLNLKSMDYDLVGIPTNDQGVTINEKTLVDVVHGLRKGFFGAGVGKTAIAASGILNITMYSPIEGLKNPEIINRIKKATGTEEKILQTFESARFVKHPNGSYWRRDLQAPFITNKRGEALIVRPSDVVAEPAVLNESKGRSQKSQVKNALNQIGRPWSIVETVAPEPAGVPSNNITLKYYILPVGWERGVILTKAEETLAKKIGANYSSGLIITPSGDMEV